MRAKICLDLTPNEMWDRHGGFGRYGYHLLEALLALSEDERAGLELLAWPRSDQPPMSGAQAMAREVLDHPEIPPWRHRTQRRALGGKLLRQAGVELFHSLHPGALPWHPGCPRLATAHDIVDVVMPNTRPGLLGRADLAKTRAELKLRYSGPDHLIAISECTRQDLIRVFGLAPAEISVVHHGVDRELYTTSRGEEGQAELVRRFDLQGPYFISVGSDHYRKNQPRLVDAFCQAQAELPETLVLVGRSIYREPVFERLMEQARQAGLARRVRWLSDVNDAELAALYRGATALVAPSLYEGFGLTLVEAMACGIPVAAARAGSYPEVGGDAVLFFDGHATDELAAALIRLSSEAPLRQDLVRRGFARADRFTWQATARATLAIYRRLLKA